MPKKLGLLFVSLFIFFNVFNVGVANAQTEQKILIDVRKPLRLDYRSRAWNRDSAKADIAALIFRELPSGQLAKITMTETGPNTAMFIGFHQLNFESAEASSELKAETFVVSASLLNRPESLREINLMIEESKLLKKPFFFRTELNGVQALSIYDSAEQAQIAQQDFLKTGMGREVVDRATLEAKRLAQLTESQKVINSAILSAENDRKRLTVSEKARREKLVLQYKGYQSFQQDRVREAARLTADRGMELYRDSKFNEAEKLFLKASDLDPENQDYYMQYGACLFKNSRFNQSLVILALVKTGGQISINERDFYMALDRVKLKEINRAYQEFMLIKNRDDKKLSPLATFYAGVIDFDQANLDSAQILFNYSIDTSSDPQLDTQAEGYLEQIANARHFKAQQDRQIFISAYTGLAYDSNVLNTNPSVTASSLKGYRGIFGGSIEYRPVYTKKYEWSAQLTSGDNYTWDDKFTPSSDLQSIDAWIVNLSLPFVYKSSVKDHAFKTLLSPGLESVQMNYDGVGSRETIVASAMLKWQNSIFFSDTWLSSYNFEVRKDNSQITPTSDEVDLTATKTTFQTSQSWFTDTTQSQALTLDLGATNNNARGANQTYLRTDLALSYFLPITTSISVNTKLAGYAANYSQHLVGRNDKSISGSFELRTSLSDGLAWLNTLSLTKNTSSIESYSYDRTALASVIAWGHNF